MGEISCTTNIFNFIPTGVYHKWKRCLIWQSNKTQRTFKKDILNVITIPYIFLFLLHQAPSVAIERIRQFKLFYAFKSFKITTRECKRLFT